MVMGMDAGCWADQHFQWDRWHVNSDLASIQWAVVWWQRAWTNIKKMTMKTVDTCACSSVLYHIMPYEYEYMNMNVNMNMNIMIMMMMMDDHDDDNVVSKEHKNNHDHHGSSDCKVITDQLYPFGPALFTRRIFGSNNLPQLLDVRILLAPNWHFSAWICVISP